MPVNYDPSSSNWQARRRAVEALERGDSRSRAQFLLDTIRSRQRDFDALSDMLQMLHAADPRIVNDLVQLSTDPNPDTRLYAVLALGELDVPEAVPALLMALRDLDPNVRFNAVEALGKLKASQAVQPLLDLLEARDFFLVFPTLEALGKIGDARALPHLLKALGNPVLALAAAQALGEMGDFTSLIPLIAWMSSSDGDIPTGVSALAAILKRYLPLSSDRLSGRSFLSAELNRIAHFIASESEGIGIQKLLGTIPGWQEGKPKGYSSTQQEYLSALALVLRFVLGAGESPTPALLDGLVLLLAVPSAREDGSQALAYCGESALPALAAALTWADPDMQYEILRILGKIGSPASAPYLFRFRNNENMELVIQAATALALIDHPEARGALVNYLEETSPQARTAITRVLAQSGQLELLDWVLGQAKNPTPQLRTALLSAKAAKKPVFQESGAALLLDLIHERTGHQYEKNSQERILDKIKPLILDQGINSFLDYYYLLKDGNGSTEQEWLQVQGALAVNETYFWREFDQIRVAAQIIVPGLHAAEGGRPVRIWNAACASGEEPYTIALALLEAGAYAGGPIEIIATDFNTDALQRAEKAVFRPSAFRAIPPSIQERYFSPLGDGKYRLAAPVRALVQFSYLNLMDSQAMEKMVNFDLIFCRNAFIYFSAPSIQKVVEQFYTALRPSGYLFVAASESLLRLTTNFHLCEIGGAFVYQKGELGR